MKAYRNVNLNLPGAMISLPVSIAPAVVKGSEDIKLSVVGPEGQELRKVYLDPEGQEVASELTKRIFNGRLVSQEELDQVKEVTKLTHLDILEIAPLKAVDFTRVQGAYFIFPNKKNGNANAFNVFVQGLKKVKAAAVVKWTPSGRQQLLAIYPEGDALLAVALAFGNDVRPADEDVTAYAQEKASKQEIELAATLLEAVMGDGSSLDSEQDEAIPMRKALLEGAPVDLPEVDHPSKPGKNLVADLEASIAALKAAKV